MTRQEAQYYILAHSAEYFKPDKSGKGYICPICGSGSGSKGTGITENPKSPNHFTCWVGCFKNADIFEIIGLQHGTPDFNEQFRLACLAFNVVLEGEPYPNSIKIQKQPVSVADYEKFIDMAAQNLGMTDYHRGISIETLKRFKVGFVPDWKVNEKAPPSPRLIIPNDGGSYLARDTRPNLTNEQDKYKKLRPKGKPVMLFNSAALKQDSDPVFIVEGELDALSIIDAGGQAVALCSAGNSQNLIDILKGQTAKPPLILAMDNDKAGKEANTKLAEGLKQAGFFFYRFYNYPEEYKDANEFLRKDREQFRKWIKAGEAFDFEAALREREAFDGKSAVARLNRFMALVKKNETQPPILTGFRNLDKLLDGGLYPGLYFIGAISSLGKTTLALQIADNIAKLGHDVLIFSLEMAETELTAKTLSRLLFIKSIDTYETAEYAKTTRGILKGHYTKIEQNLLLQSFQEYSEWGENIRITEGMQDIGVSHVRAGIEEYIKDKGKTPVVFIDYLQIMAAPEDKRSFTDKQVVDKNVSELKRISRDFDLPLIAVSSFNRENYSSPVNMAAFKESGAVEYSSDVLIGLQYKGWDYQEGEKGEKDNARLQRLRGIRERNEAAARNLGSQDIQLKILKYRAGNKGSCYFEFFPAFNYFKEVIE